MKEWTLTRKIKGYAGCSMMTVASQEGVPQDYTSFPGILPEALVTNNSKKNNTSKLDEK